MLADSMEASGGELREQRVPDSTHALMSAAMLDAKRARMKVEADREALANRINRLQLEEVRATKRIEQTHRRTNEIISAKNRHAHQQVQKEVLRAEHEQLVEQHREALGKIRDERKQALARAKASVGAGLDEIIRANRESHQRNAEAIAHARAAELNHAMFKRNEVRRVEADARERKLREKELMIAHLQQRAEERQGEETRRAEELDRKLAELERQEYELLVALEGHKAEREHVYRQLENQLVPSGSGGSSTQQAITDQSEEPTAAASTGVLPEAA